jgi:hypothetical protein
MIILGHHPMTPTTNTYVYHRLQECVFVQEGLVCSF